METHPEIKRLNEANLSRIWNICIDPERDFMIVSADRNDVTNQEEKASRTAWLRAEIRSLDLGFSELEGHWTENAGTSSAKNVVERSFFAGGPIGAETTSKLDKLESFVFGKLGQEAVLRKGSAGDIGLRYANGSSMSLGRFSPDKVAHSYSAIVKGSHAGRTFTFECAIGRNWTEEMIRSRTPGGYGPFC